MSAGIYKGIPNGRVQYVEPDGSATALPPRRDLRNHSPDGFSWGYGGSGPSQLALAICAHALGDDDAALAVYQDFKWQEVARIPMDAPWMLSKPYVLAVCRSIQKARAA